MQNKVKALVLTLSVAMFGGVATAQAAPDWYQPDSSGEITQGANRQAHGGSTPIVVVQGQSTGYLVGKNACSDENIGRVTIVSGSYHYCTGPNSSAQLPHGGGNSTDPAIVTALENIATAVAASASGGGVPAGMPKRRQCNDLLTSYVCREWVYEY